MASHFVLYIWTVSDESSKLAPLFYGIFWLLSIEFIAFRDFIGETYGLASNVCLGCISVHIILPSFQINVYSCWNFGIGSRSSWILWSS